MLPLIYYCLKSSEQYFSNIVILHDQNSSRSRGRKGLMNHLVKWCKGSKVCRSGVYDLLLLTSDFYIGYCWTQ